MKQPPLLKGGEMQNLIPIEITEAEVQSILINYKEDKIEYGVTLILKTSEGQEITTLSLSSENWDEKRKITTPITLFSPCEEILKIAKEEAIRTVNASRKLLG